MNTAELKKLAEAAIHSDTVAIPFARAEFHAAANPAAILELLAINSELVEALKNLIESADSMAAGYGRIYGETPEDDDTFTHEKWAEEFLAERTDEARAALAKAEGTES